METIVIGALALVAGFIGGWVACKKLGPQVGAIETDVKKL